MYCWHRWCQSFCFCCCSACCCWCCRCHWHWWTLCWCILFRLLLLLLQANLFLLLICDSWYFTSEIEHFDDICLRQYFLTPSHFRIIIIAPDSSCVPHSNSTPSCSGSSIFKSRQLFTNLIIRRIVLCACVLDAVLFADVVEWILLIIISIICKAVLCEVGLLEGRHWNVPLINLSLKGRQLFENNLIPLMPSSLAATPSPHIRHLWWICILSIYHRNAIPLPLRPNAWLSVFGFLPR